MRLLELCPLLGIAGVPATHHRMICEGHDLSDIGKTLEECELFGTVKMRLESSPPYNFVHHDTEEKNYANMRCVFSLGFQLPCHDYLLRVGDVDDSQESFIITVKCGIILPQSSINLEVVPSTSIDGIVNVLSVVTKILPKYISLRIMDNYRVWDKRLCHAGEVCGQSTLSDLAIRCQADIRPETQISILTPAWLTDDSYLPNAAKRSAAEMSLESLAIKYLADNSLQETFAREDFAGQLAHTPEDRIYRARAKRWVGKWRKILATRMEDERRGAFPKPSCLVGTTDNETESDDGSASPEERAYNAIFRRLPSDSAGLRINPRYITPVLPVGGAAEEEEEPDSQGMASQLLVDDESVADSQLQDEWSGSDGVTSDATGETMGWCEEDLTVIEYHSDHRHEEIFTTFGQLMRSDFARETFHWRKFRSHPDYVRPERSYSTLDKKADAESRQRLNNLKIRTIRRSLNLLARANATPIINTVCELLTGPAKERDVLLAAIQVVLGQKKELVELTAQAAQLTAKIAKGKADTVQLAAEVPPPPRHRPPRMFGLTAPAMGVIPARRLADRPRSRSRRPRSSSRWRTSWRYTLATGASTTKARARFPSRFSKASSLELSATKTSEMTPRPRASSDWVPPVASDRCIAIWYCQVGRVPQLPAV